MNTLETINQEEVYTIDGSFKGNDKKPPFTKKGEIETETLLKCFNKIVILRNQKFLKKVKIIQINLL